MQNISFKQANTEDIPFLVKTIIEAEKSGTEKLSYTTIFGLSEETSIKYITKMLLEEVDDCELSISSFLLAEHDGQIVAAIAAWIEGLNMISSAILKGNLLNYTLPRECIQKATKLNYMLQDLHIECLPNTVQLGLVYVSPNYRGLNLVKSLIEQKIQTIHKVRPNIKEMHVQVFGNNLSAIRCYEKNNFIVRLVKESSNDEIVNYLPSAKKILMIKKLALNKEVIKNNE